MDKIVRFFESWPIKLFYALLFSVPIFFYSINNPFYNWDTVGYVASVISFEENDYEKIQRETYGDIKSYFPPEKYEQIKSGSDYRETVYSDPRALSQQVPFYKIRYFYLKFLSVVSGFTESISEATVYTSAIFCFLISLATAWYFARLGFLYYLFPFILLPIRFISLSRVSTPDAMASFFAFIAVMLYQDKKTLSLFILSFLPLIRTDFIILAFVMFLVRIYKGGKWWEYLFFAASFAVYMWVNKYAGNYGHLTIFNFTLIPNDLRPYPEQMPISTDVKDYFEAYLSGAYSFFSRGDSLIFIASVLLVLVDLLKREIKFSTLGLIIGSAFLAVHFSLFPAAFQRTYFAANLVMLYFLIFKFCCSKEMPLIFRLKKN